MILSFANKELLEDISSKEIAESIKYASEIQYGLLPKERHFSHLNFDYAIWYQPHSVLSGDFFWIGKKNGDTYIAVGDCTGHGIPASLLTVMGINLLNYIILGKDYFTLGEYFKEIDKKWVEIFFSDHEDTTFNNDWMELSVLKINKEKKEIEFCGACTKAFFKASNNMFHVLTGNRFPIGGWQVEKNRIYISKKFNYNLNDEIYLFTDGIIDQFGGERNKRFGIRNFQILVKNLTTSNMKDNIHYIKDIINIWKGNNKQTDDITLMALRFN